MPESITLIATAPFGLEAVVSRELNRIGFTDTRTENGRVTFPSDLHGLCRANLWLRTAERVLVRMGEFQATTFDELYELTKAIPWEEWIVKEGAFPVTGKSIQSQLSSVPACQRIVKKAIADRLAHQYGVSPLPETGATYAVEVALLKDTVTLTLDSSGAGLHRRGYRSLATTAQLKETLAAALVYLSRWESHRPFADPLCGSGTIAIEAAMIARNLAPGQNREFASESWTNRVDPALWREARNAARESAIPSGQMEISGSDIDPEAISLANYHAKRAGVSRDLRFTVKPVERFRSDLPYGCLVSNPPYGERLGDRMQVEQVYREMGDTFRSLDRWSAFVLTAHRGFERAFGKNADKRRKLYNGPLECQLYQYLGPFPAFRPNH